MSQHNRAALIKWTVIGTVLQVIMVVSGHYNEFIATNVFALGGMSISLLAGAGYGAGVASRGGGAVGGLIAGGACALIGIAVSVALGDVPTMILAVGTLSSAVSGAIGGFIAALVASRQAATT